MYMYPTYTSRWVFRNYVRIKCQGGDSLQENMFCSCIISPCLTQEDTCEERIEW